MKIMIERDRKDNTPQSLNISYKVLDIIHGQLFKMKQNLQVINEDAPERVFGMMRLLSIAPHNSKLVKSPLETLGTHMRFKGEKSALMR